MRRAVRVDAQTGSDEAAFTDAEEYCFSNRRAGQCGTCQCCLARGKYVIEARELEPLFDRFTDRYSPLEVGANVPPDVDVLRVGDQLATLIQDQWGIFSERLAGSDRHHDLLHEIFTVNCREEEILDAPAVRDLWTNRDWLHATLLGRWHELADKLRRPEHYEPVAPESVPTPDDLATATGTLGWFEEDVGRACVTLPARSKIFRARLQASRRLRICIESIQKKKEGEIVMEYRVVVAHSERDEAVHSDDNVKIITPAHKELLFDEAKEYMKTGSPKGEYASAAVGTCHPLSDGDYNQLFQANPPAAPAGRQYVDTGKRVAGDVGGKKIYALRNGTATLQDIGAWARSFDGKVILLACRVG